jgi:hypothetical protein
MMMMLTLMVSIPSSWAFQQQAPSFVRQSAFRTSPTTTGSSFIGMPSPKTTSTSSTARSMTLEDVNHFYQDYPLQAAVLTCGVKASLADCIAQIQSWTSSDRAIEVRRNAGYIIYGGIFIGLMCHLEYDYVFPQLFGTEHNLKTIVELVLFDNFVSAPLMWLPPCYMIKAILYDYPLAEGLERYITDVRQGLLLKYWAVWLPAQSISFSVIPDHLRVAFMAFISFFWFIILSTSTSQSNTADAAATP